MLLTVRGLSGSNSPPVKAAHPPEKALVAYFSWGGNSWEIVTKTSPGTTSCSLW